MISKGRCMTLRMTCGSIFLIAALCLAACGGGGGRPRPAPTYMIGGTLSGLPMGQQVVLKDNGADSLTLSVDGAFTFKTAVAANGSYSASVATQPTGQACTVANATGTVAMADVTTITVVCAALPKYAYVVNNGDNTVSQYTIGAAGELTPMTVATGATGTSPHS